MAKLTIVTPIHSEKVPVIEKKKTEKKTVVKPITVVLKAAGVPEKAKLPVEKTFEFEMFLIWDSIPSFFKNPPTDKKSKLKPSVQEFCESMGIEDETVLELAQIQTATAFAEKYGVSKDTLTDWRKLIRERDLLADLASWTRPLTRNVMMSLYNQCLRGGLPEHYKLWLQTVAGWSEKSLIDIRKRTIKTVRVEVLHKTQ